MAIIKGKTDPELYAAVYAACIDFLESRTPRPDPLATMDVTTGDRSG